MKPRPDMILAVARTQNNNKTKTNTNEVVCTVLSGKEPEVDVDRVMELGNTGGVMVITPAWNANHVGSNPSLNVTFPTFFIPSTTSTITKQDWVQVSCLFVVALCPSNI